MAWWPSIEMSAPMRESSPASMKRFSKMFSVMTQLPLARARRTMVCACMSVGKPGKGRVWMSVGTSGRSRQARHQSGPRSIVMPICSYFLRTRPRWRGAKPRTVTGSPARAPATRKVPASMRSPTTRCSTGWSSETPSISITGEPAPEILAPISFSRFARSTISGSRAALSIVVTPLAKTDAIIRFSVAPTLAKLRVTVAPVSPCGALAWMLPCLTSNSTPSASRPRMCMSMLRAPMLQPPGIATIARPKRESRGPRTAVDARICATRW